MMNTTTNFARSEERQLSAGLPVSSPLRPTNGNSKRQRIIHTDDDVLPTEDNENTYDSELAEIMGTHKDHQRQQKENRGLFVSPNRPRAFIDTQDDAERITEFTQDTQAENSAPQAFTRSSSSKRKRNQTADDDAGEQSDAPTEDGGFQTDLRDLDPSQRRRSAPKTASPKKVRIAEPARGSPRQAGGDLPDTSVRDYAEQQQILNSQNVRTPQFAPRAHPRVNIGRIRWDPASEKRLQDMVAEFGPSWALIKRIDEEGDNLFEGRDQVALKDKARNMKVAMIL
jgi:hypothetical protein